MPNATTHTEAYFSFAAELACAPQVYRRLLLEHVSNGADVCLGCTMPGSQTSYPAPCALHKIAMEAARIRSTWPRRQQ